MAGLALVLEVAVGTRNMLVSSPDPTLSRGVRGHGHETRNMRC